MLTKELMQQALPPALKKRATQAFVDKVNLVINDPIHADLMIENILGYTEVLKQGKYRMTDYVNAVRYVSYKNMDLNNQRAWAATFPDRYTRLVSAGASAKDISASVSAYNKNKLVNLIYDQSLIPIYIINAATQQKAINILADKMANGASERIQVDAAGLLLLHLKRPEVAKVELDIAVSDSSHIDELKRLTREMADNVVSQIGAGTMSAKDAAHQSVCSTVDEEGNIIG